jgi:hypothetical protein
MEATEKKSELVKLVETSGLEKTKQNQIAETLGLFFNKAAEWDTTIQSIVITSPEETGKMKMAREGRLTLKNMRLEAEKIVKAKRDEIKYAIADFVLEDKLWLKAGQMIEATFKNLETKLEEKEKFAERWEAERKEKLRAERLALLLPFGYVSEKGVNLADMDEDTFQKFKLGLETAKREREEAERKAEEERIAREKAEAEERARIKAENERLKAEAEAKEKKLAEERVKAEAERKEMELKLAKLKAEAEAKLKLEREEKEKLQAEIRAKAEAEEKAKREAEMKALAELKAKRKAEEKLAKAPIKKQLKAWVDSFSIGKPITENEITIEIEKKFEEFIKWAKNKIEAL